MKGRHAIQSSTVGIVMSISLVASSILLALTNCHQPVFAAFPLGYNGRLAFTSDRDRGNGYVDIYVTSTTPGSAVVRLTNNTGEVWDVHPAWSPDGSRIAFGRFLDGDYEVFVMDADGSDVLQLTDNEYDDYQPAWSPDGTKIAYSTREASGGDWEIWLMNPDGTGKTALTTNTGITDYEPDWSPDGTQIAFERDGDICVMDANGTNVIQLTSNVWYDAEPQWHPDGARVVFTSVESGNPEISVLEVATKAVTHLTNDGLNKWEPGWSPDGQKIVFQRNETGIEGDWEIVIINADGSNAVKLTNNDDWDQHPAWQRLPSSRAWVPMTSGTTHNLWGVWGSSPSDVFAVGQHGTILHYNGTSWNPMTSGASTELNAVWGSSSANVFAVGGTYVYGSGNSGVILRYDGTSWTTIYTDPGYQYFGVWGSGPNDVFAVGSGGRIVHYNGSGWTPMASGTGGAALEGIWGVGPTDVFACGALGNIVHYDGTSWTKMTSGATNWLRAVWGTAPNDVLVAGDQVILRYDGTSWSAMSGASQEPFASIRGNSTADVFAVGYSGTMQHYDGTVWNAIGSGTGYALLDIWSSAWNDVFAVGAAGTIIHSGAITFTAHSPVDIAVRDPEGLMVSKTLNQIPGATYVQTDLDGDGDPDDRVSIPLQKTGSYLVTVTPEPGVSPDDTYTLETSMAGATMVLAKDVPVGQIPLDGYTAVHNPAGVMSAKLDLNPGILNLKSKGVITAYIELPISWNVLQVDPSSAWLNGIVPSLGSSATVGDQDRDGIPDLMVKFDRSALQMILSAGGNIKITITGKWNDMAFEGSDYIKVIN